MSAATTLPETVSPWTMGRNVSAVSYTHLDVYKRQDTFLPIVQSDTVSVDVVAALMHQPPRSAVLAVIHDGDRFSPVFLHK